MDTPNARHDTDTYTISNPGREDISLDVLFDSIGDAIIMTDENAVITRVNPAATTITGYSEEELVGEWYPGLVIANDMDNEPVNALDRPIMTAFMEGKPVYARMQYLRKDGSMVPCSLTVAPLLLNERPVGAIQVFRDISVELELERAKDEFISIASHQLRTPATGVKQYLGMLIDGYADDLKDEQQTLLEKAYESNERQLKIIDDLLRIARADAGQVKLNKQKTDVIRLVHDVIQEQSDTLHLREQQVDFHYPRKGVEAVLDDRRIRMVLENILDNASKYTPHGKTITIRITQKLSTVYIEVKDEGIGIEPLDIAKIFQKFARLDRDASHNVEGSGLGLYWVQKIIDLHGGKVLVKSKPGQGTSFTLKLPKDG